ncbi:3812_t:CDS:2 [Entrophospora sp. SA101]|nr:3812_t:CDS:2 [Entrophospora sp. SA101]CAJ0836934.1 13518_t:CDS:2 [Entrophospora sp. SA101]
MDFINTPQILITESRDPKIITGLRLCPGYIGVSEGDVDSNTINTGGRKLFDFTVEGKFIKSYGAEYLDGDIESAKNSNIISIKNYNSSSFKKDRNNCMMFRPEDSMNYEYNQDDPSKIIKSFLKFNIKPSSSNSAPAPPFFSVNIDRLNVNNLIYRLTKNLTTELDDNEPSLQYNVNTILKNQKTILEYYTIIHKRFSTTLLGQIGSTKPNRLSLEVKTNSISLPLSSSASNNVLAEFVLLPSQFLRFENEKYEYQAGSMISNLGGFYGAIVALYVSCFGMSKIQPWGVFQRAIFRCHPCRRSFKKHLAKRYISSAGIPLGEEIDDRPQNASLEDRLQILEYLLKDYYLDSYYLEKLKQTKLKYNKAEQKFTELEELYEKQACLNNVGDEDEGDENNTRNNGRRRCGLWQGLYRVSFNNDNQSDNNIEEAGGSDSGNEFEKIGITLEK